MSDEERVFTRDVNNMVKELVQSILLLDCKKKPFRQADLVCHLSQKPSRALWKTVLDEAKKNLDQLGLKLVETRDASTKSFFVVSKTRPLPFMYKFAAVEEISSRMLLTVILTYIFMKNGTVMSGELLCHLRDLKIYNDNEEPHPYFGYVKKKIFNDYVEQLYLSCSKIPDSDAHEISWGHRAEVEVDKISILEIVCQCGYDNKIVPRSFVSHYEKAMEEHSVRTTVESGMQ